MHDLRWIRENPAEFDRGLERRGLPPCADQVLALDREWRRLETEAQESQASANRTVINIGNLLICQQVQAHAGPSELPEEVRLLQEQARQAKEFQAATAAQS